MKCVVAPARLDGRPVVVKALVSRASPWRFMLAHERAIHEALARAPSALPTIAVPRIAAEVPVDADLLVFERAPGDPLVTRRHDTRAQIAKAAWAALLDARRALHASSEALVCAADAAARAAPSPSDTAAMRRRWLEDPTSRGAWIVEGTARLGARGFLSAADASLVERALRAHPAVAFAHGDLLLRNVLRADDGRLSLVDWECAGAHHEAWDAATLWISAPEWVRNALREDHAGDAARAALLACVAFALAREIAYRRRVRARGVVDASLAADLADALRELGQAT